METKSVPKPLKDLLWPLPPAPSPASTRKSPRRPVQAIAAAAPSSSTVLHSVHALVLPQSSSAASSAIRDCISLLRRHGARCSTTVNENDDACITHVIVVVPPLELSDSESAAAAAMLSMAPCSKARVVTTGWLHACAASGVYLCASVCLSLPVAVYLHVCVIHSDLNVLIMDESQALLPTRVSS